MMIENDRRIRSKLADLFDAVRGQTGCRQLAARDRGMPVLGNDLVPVRVGDRIDDATERDVPSLAEILSEQRTGLMRVHVRRGDVNAAGKRLEMGPEFIICRHIRRG